MSPKNKSFLDADAECRDERLLNLVTMSSNDHRSLHQVELQAVRLQVRALATLISNFRSKSERLSELLMGVANILNNIGRQIQSQADFALQNWPENYDRSVHGMSIRPTETGSKALNKHPTNIYAGKTSRSAKARAGK